MVQALRDLAMEFQMDFVHFTEQAHHNKDEVDGDAITLNLRRHTPDDENHIEVLNSESFVKFVSRS